MIENVETKPIVTREEITPTTIEEYRVLENLVLYELGRIEKAVTKREEEKGTYFIRDPREDPDRIQKERGTLLHVLTGIISLHYPTLHLEGSCVLLKIKGLMASFVDNEPTEPLFHEADCAFHTLRLADAAVNMVYHRKTSKKIINPLSFEDLVVSFSELSRRSPAYTYSQRRYWENDLIEEYLIYQAVLVKTKNDGNRVKLDHLLSCGFYFHQMEKRYWPLIKKLIEKRYKFAVDIRFRNGERHTDLITDVDLEKSRVTLKIFPTMTFAELEKAMEPEYLPLTMIPPFEVGLPDKTEFKILKQLLE